MTEAGASQDRSTEISPAPPRAAPAGARIGLLLGACLFSTGGAAIKSCRFSALEVAGLRSLIALGFILLFVPGARRLRSPRTWIVGFAYAATMLTYVASNKLTSAIDAIYLQSTAPLYLLLLGPLLLGERIRPRDLLFLAAIACGMGLFFVGAAPATATASDPFLGKIVAAVSGLTWALTILGLRWLGRGSSTEGRGPAGAPAPTAASAVVAGNALTLLVAAVAVPLLSPGLPEIAGGAAGDWLSVAYLGLFQVGLAYVFVTRGMARVPAFEASLLLMIEPVLNPIWAYIFEGEEPGRWSILGGAVILAATLAQPLMDFARKRG